MLGDRLLDADPAVERQRESGIVQSLVGIILTMRRASGIEGLSSSQVSRAAALLDDELESWRNRPLGEIRHLILDARDEVASEIAVGGFVETKIRAFPGHEQIKSGAGREMVQTYLGYIRDPS